MSEELAILRGISAAPAERTLRLAYADWLDDHGQTEADHARAQFVRLNCELECLPENSAEWKDVSQALDERWRIHHEVWEAPLRALGVARNEPIIYNRGLPHSLPWPIEDFLTNGREALRIAPTATHARLYLPGGSVRLPDLHRLVAGGHLGGLTGLELRRAEIGAEGARMLAECPDLAGLTELTLTQCPIGPVGAAALADSRYMAGLSSLELFGSGIGPEGGGVGEQSETEGAHETHPE